MQPAVDATIKNAEALLKSLYYTVHNAAVLTKKRSSSDKDAP